MSGVFLPGSLREGNPIYRWTDAKKVMDEATGRSTLGLAGEQFNLMMVNRSPNDGMVYALVYAAENGVYVGIDTGP